MFRNHGRAAARRRGTRVVKAAGPPSSALSRRVVEAVRSHPVPFPAARVGPFRAEPHLEFGPRRRGAASLGRPRSPGRVLSLAPAGARTGAGVPPRSYCHRHLFFRF